jgi:acyl-CoA reductase-like NAD-dependent aldehyde dehydrogenase
VPYEEVVQKLAAAVTGLASNPKAAPHVFGAIQNPATHDRVKQLAFDGGRSILAHGTVDNPMFANARTCSPSIHEIDSSRVEQFSQELFGPIMLVIKPGAPTRASAWPPSSPASTAPSVAAPTPPTSR